MNLAVPGVEEGCKSRDWVGLVKVVLFITWLEWKVKEMESKDARERERPPL